MVDQQSCGAGVASTTLQGTASHSTDRLVPAISPPTEVSRSAYEFEPPTVPGWAIETVRHIGSKKIVTYRPA